MPDATPPPAAGVFDQYARYYDLLYRDKDYAAEARFVDERLRASGMSGHKLLELGCGTGRHGVEFARLGYQVCGIDLSEGMVRQAEARAKALPPELGSRLRFGVGDVRSVRRGETFDAVLSLFHVMSYQTTDADLRAAIKTAATHLKPGGLFLFDFWHGPAVLADPPVVRVKRLEDAALEVTRIAEPDFQPGRHCVIVNYQIFLKDRARGQFSEMRESHPMRYLFLPEIESGLIEERMALVASGGWVSDKPLSSDTWYGWVVARRSSNPADIPDSEIRSVPNKHV